MKKVIVSKNCKNFPEVLLALLAASDSIWDCLTVGRPREAHEVRRAWLHGLEPYEAEKVLAQNVAWDKADGSHAGEPVELWLDGEKITSVEEVTAKGGWSYNLAYSTRRGLEFGWTFVGDGGDDGPWWVYIMHPSGCFHEGSTLLKSALEAGFEPEFEEVAP